jgi:adenylosuccinate synthase
LEREVRELDEAGYDASTRLVVDPEATLLEERHALEETGGRTHGEAGITASIGSTGKGVGAARADRLWRKAARIHELAPTGKLALQHKLDREPGPGGVTLHVSDTAEAMTQVLRQGGLVQVEGTQGFGLGLHAGFYPYCTTQDCRAIDVLAQAGLSPWMREVREFEIWVVFRTFPIRVAGNSGPLFGETTWERVGQTPERTTVTKKTRRIGEWDPILARRAIAANGGAGWGHPSPARVALLFLDYVYQDLAGCLDPGRIWEVARDYIWSREDEMGCPISAVGVGPSQIVCIRDEDDEEVK